MCRYRRHLARTSPPRKLRGEARVASLPGSVQGKPAARRGRKARDLARPDETARLPAEGCRLLWEVSIVKANLARFTMALAALAVLFFYVDGTRWFLVG